MELSKELIELKKAKQKLAYAKDLFIEAIADICEIRQGKTEIESDFGHIVTVQKDQDAQDNIFILAFQASKLEKQDFAFIDETIRSIEKHLETQPASQQKTSLRIVELDQKST